MPTFTEATVTELLSDRRGLQRVRLDDGSRAYCLTELTGEVAAGDRVVLNTSAVELGLGTGGWHVVHWNLSRPARSTPQTGHVMKLRYTSLQHPCGTSELDHPGLPDQLGGMPVVVCLVHSQVATAAVAARASLPTDRLAYVMTDGAALPLALSDLVAAMVDRGVIDTTITAGHAFGGDLEAVSVASGLLMARHVADARIAVVGMGPGVVGTGTPYGTSALEAAAVIDTVAALGGRPVLAVRASSSDPRERHRGISHHVTSVLRCCTARPAVAAVEGAVPAALARHAVAVTVGEPGAMLAAAGLEVTHMGRSPAEDPLFFRAAAAAGAVAAAMADGP